MILAQKNKSFETFYITNHIQTQTIDVGVKSMPGG
jgi:hypothetical protein